MERKSKNYYRAELQRSKLSAYNALRDVLRKYGRKDKISPRKINYKLFTGDTEEGYNRGTTWWIKGFELCHNGKIYILVYWQSDSTDGDEYLDMPKDIYSNAFLEPSKPVNMGSYYYTARQGISISPSEIWEAIKTIKI